MEAIGPLRFRGHDIVVFHLLDRAELEFEYADPSAFDADELDEADGFTLSRADVCEVLRELGAWRSLDGSRLDIIERLAEDLERYMDPAPQEQTGGNI